MAMSGIESKKRCPWCLGSDAYIAYHDREWGTPVHDERMLFELLILEGAQAGLSWSTILNKRDNYRKAFVPPSSAYRKHVLTWSFTMPVACMNA